MIIFLHNRFWAVSPASRDKLPLCVPPKAEQKNWLTPLSGVFAFGEPNLQILERKLFFDFKNPYKIIAFAEPEPRTRINSVRDKLREGEAIPSQTPEIVKWRCLLDKIRTYFEQNPDADI